MEIVKDNSIGDNSQFAGRDINHNEVYIYANSNIKNIPKLSDEYETREEENDIIKKLNEQGIVCICGISGIGKSSISIAIENKIESEYEQIIYIDGSKLKSKDEISNLFIERGTYKDNIEELLIREKILLIIDNMISNQGNVITKLEEMELKNSKIIITTQCKDYIDPKYIYELNAPTNKICKKILLRDIEKDLEYNQNIDLILEKVSGNPLMLKIINRVLKYEQMTIEELVEDISEITSIDDIDNGEQRVCDRIMNIFLQNCENGINVISWLESTYIDKKLLKYMIGNINYHKIERRFIFDTTIQLQSDTVKIHEIVLNSIKNIVELEEIKHKEYIDKFINYFSHIYKSKDESKEFWNALYLHKNKIKKINSDNNEWGLKLYLLIKCSFDYEIDYNMDKKIDFKYLENCYYREEIYFEFISVIEFLERKKYNNKFENEHEKLEFLETCINFIEKSLENQTIDADLKTCLTHHLGKFYFYTNDKDRAKEQFEKVIEYDENNFEAKLQLIKMYKKQDGNSEGDNLRKIKHYIGEILTAYKVRNYTNTTIVLATIGQLRKYIFKDELRAYILDDLEGFKDLILNESNFYFDLPFKTFVEIGKKFLYDNPKMYEEIAKLIPIKISEEINDNAMLFNIGEFYKDLTRAKISNEDIDEEEKQYLLKQSEIYYKKVKNPDDYQLKEMCQLYILYEKPDEVFKVSKQIRNLEDPFIFYYLSQAYEILYKKNETQQENIGKALQEINKSINVCIKNSKFEQYKSTFYNQKSNLLNYKKDKNCITLLEEAILYCTNKKYKKELELKLEKLKKIYI